MGDFQSPLPPVRGSNSRKRVVSLSLDKGVRLSPRRFFSNPLLRCLGRSARVILLVCFSLDLFLAVLGMPPCSLSLSLSLSRADWKSVTILCVPMASQANSSWVTSFFWKVKGDKVWNEKNPTNSFKGIMSSGVKHLGLLPSPL